MMSPGGALSMIAWVKLNDTSTRWCCFATHTWPSPEESKKLPVMANTLSSSVSFVQTERTPALPIGQYVLYTDTTLRPLIPPLALMSSTNAWYTLSWSTRIESTKSFTQLKSMSAMPSLISVGVTPTPRPATWPPDPAVADV